MSLVKTFDLFLSVLLSVESFIGFEGVDALKAFTWLLCEKQTFESSIE